MGFQLDAFFLSSAAAILIAGTVLVLISHRDLGASGGVSRPRVWLLSVMLGTGILAFGIKLIVVAAITSDIDAAVHLLPRGEQLRQPVSVPSIPPETGPSGYVWQALPESPDAPRDNPPTSAKVALGARLFNDPRLSRTGEIACSSCHALQAHAGSDGKATSSGVEQRAGSRNAPTVWNAAFQNSLFWDGRATNLEEQAAGPLTHPNEMGMTSVEAVAARLRGIDDYERAFGDVFGGVNAVTGDNVVRALAAFERTLVTADTAYDRFVRGDMDALRPEQLRGMALFEEVGCVLCHSGPNFSAAAEGPAANGLRAFPAVAGSALIERYDLATDPGAAPADSEIGIWRVPSLRNVALTAPYFHNGAVTDLAEAVRIMATVQLGKTIRAAADRVPRLHWSSKRRILTRSAPDALSEDDIRAIVAFLRSLSSDRLLATARSRHADHRTDRFVKAAD